MQTYLILFCKNIWEINILQNEFSKPAPMIKAVKTNAGLLVLSKFTFDTKSPIKTNVNLPNCILNRGVPM